MWLERVLAKNERDTRISCTRIHLTAACAAFFKESRMRFGEFIKVRRKSGGMGHPWLVVRTEGSESGPWFVVSTVVHSQESTRQLAITIV